VAMKDNFKLQTAEILNGLNPRQIEAVTHLNGPLLILAGAGSGKTTVLTRRIAYLLAKGVKPWQILAITFTNKAARELKNRIESLLGKDAEGIWAMTFHAMCARILRREFPNIGRSGKFSIMDVQDQIRIMRKVLKELNISEKQYPPSNILRKVSAAKNNLVDPETYQKRVGTFYETKVAQAYSLYQRKLQELDALDFDDLIMQTVFTFRKNRYILEKYQNKFLYILVDEYQDTNRAQYELTKMLASSHKNIAVVGDDDQSIYTFRGADLRNILEFEKDYPSCHIVKLEQNYRSTQIILDGAYHVVSNNFFRKEKRLWTAKKGGSPIIVYASLNEEDEARFVADEILKLLTDKRSFGSFAILYRTHAQSRTFEDAFIERQIPYSILGSLRFYERKEIKDAISYLRLLAYPKDYVSLERVINEPHRGLGPASVRRIINYASENDLSIIDALCQASSIPRLTSKGKKSAEKLGKILREVSFQIGSAPPHQILSEILDKTGYREQLEREGTPESLARLENLEELLASMRVFDSSGKGDLYEYLESQALASDQDSYDEKKDACVMMTLHAAKGLEFDVVFMVGVEEGLLPHVRSIGEERQIEEERRLCYVGMTRARELLYLTFAAYRETYLGKNSTKVSRFLSEIPQELLEVRSWQYA